jgi:AcrR family transcriptional regulator
MSKQGKTADKESTILRAAAELFTEKDFHAVLMEEVSVRAGVGKGTLYRYFPTKEHLYFCTILAGWDQLREELEHALGEEESLTTTLHNVVRRILVFFWQRRQFITLVYRLEAQSASEAKMDWQRRRDAFVRQIEDVLKKAMRNGDLPASEDTRLTTELLLGMVRAAILYRSQRDTPDALARLVISLFLRGVAGQTWRDKSDSSQTLTGGRTRERKVAAL